MYSGKGNTKKYEKRKPRKKITRKLAYTRNCKRTVENFISTVDCEQKIMVDDQWKEKEIESRNEKGLIDYFKNVDKKLYSIS